MTAGRRWLRIPEAAEYLGISVKGAYEMAAAGKLPAARVGRLVRIDLRALEARMEAEAQGRPADSGKGRRVQ